MSLNLPYRDDLKHDLSKPTRLDRDVAKHEDRQAKARAKRQREREADAAWRVLREQIWRRDGGVCRATGQPLELYHESPLRMTQTHHIVWRSAGGKDVSSNLISVSARIHDEIHAHKLDVSGNGDELVTFTRRNLETGKIERSWDSRPRGKK